MVSFATKPSSAFVDRVRNHFPQPGTETALTASPAQEAKSAAFYWPGSTGCISPLEMVTLAVHGLLFLGCCSPFLTNTFVISNARWKITTSLFTISKEERGRCLKSASLSGAFQGCVEEQQPLEHHCCHLSPSFFKTGENCGLCYFIATCPMGKGVVPGILSDSLWFYVRHTWLWGPRSPLDIQPLSWVAFWDLWLPEEVVLPLSLIPWEVPYCPPPQLDGSVFQPWEVPDVFQKLM